MHRIDKPLPIFRLQVGEVKIQLIGGAPQVWARIALMTEEGITLGDTTYTAISEESMELINKLSLQLEKDYEKTLRNTNYQQWEEEQEKPIENETIDYSSDWSFT